MYPVPLLPTPPLTTTPPLPPGQRMGHLYLTTRVTLDREETSTYRLTVTTHDMAVTPLYASLTIAVSVADTNDNAPRFSSPHYKVRSDEILQVGALIVQVI